MTPPHSVGLVPHRERPQAHALARQVATWFVEHDVEVRLPAPEAEAAGLSQFAVDEKVFGDGLDLAVTLGGDGTMLHTVRLVYPGPASIFGVNVGQLGYLTAIEPAELDTALPRLLSGDVVVSERMMLEVRVETRDASAGTHYALNEAVLEKQRAGHLVRLDVSINGSPFTAYAADGVIIATPTGSTAYSFSARGPIVSPALRCLLLTPISPHMLFDRTLVLAENEELGFVCDGRTVVLTLDGRELGELVSDDRVTCLAAPEPLRLVALAPRDFHQILKAKFALPDR